MSDDLVNNVLKDEYERRECEKTETGYRDVGDDPTLPGQVEIVAGTPEQERLLKAYPQATMYGPDVNVVVPPPPASPEVEDQEDDEGSNY